MSDNDGSIVAVVVLALFIGILIVAAATGSASRDAYYDYWSGKTEAHLYSQYGAPTRTFPLETGGKIAVYDRGTVLVPVEGGYVVHRHGYRWWYPPSYVQRERTIQFFMDSEGIIYRVMLKEM